jgi:hypothetical protein
MACSIPSIIPKEFGAPRDYHIIFFFGESDAVRIDTENVVEIFAK